MGDTVRRVGDIYWTRDQDEWSTSRNGSEWLLIRHGRWGGRTPGWYLHQQGGDNHAQWAGKRIERALKVATLLLAGEWSRTGLRRPYGTPTWVRTRTREVVDEPSLLSGLVVRRG